MDIRDFKMKFDEKLSAYLDVRIERLRVLLDDAELASYVEATKTIALQGGKRARPYMATAMYKAFGGTDEELIGKVGLGLELFHLFCLVHDDVIDKADKRHSVSTVHTVAFQNILRENTKESAEHLSNGQAVLVGDLLFAWASESFRDGVGDLENRHRVLRLYFQMIDDVVAGQMIDVGLMAKRVADEGLVRKKMELKTATYSFVRPLQIGLALAGGEEMFEQTLQEFGLKAGLAFQLQDDLLDLLSTEEQVGKPCMNDIREGQHTLLSDYFLRHASEEDKQRFSAFFGNRNLKPEECAEILSMMKGAGVVSYAQNELANAFTESTNIAMNSVLPEAAKNVLFSLVSTIKARTT
jgi:geranylgeranyl diphosphate synthase type I